MHFLILFDEYRYFQQLCLLLKELTLAWVAVVVVEAGVALGSCSQP